MENNNTASTTFNEFNNWYSNYCANRLPCGYCRILGSMCPISGWTITSPNTPINYNEVTCKNDS